MTFGILRQRLGCSAHGACALRGDVATGSKMHPEFSDPKTWLAVYGAGLSTALAAREFWKSRRNVKVATAWGTAPTTMGEPIRVLTVTTTNHGHRSVVIKMAGLMTIQGAQLVDPEFQIAGDWPLPKKLEDGESVDVYLEHRRLLARIVEMRSRGDSVAFAYARDSADRVYRCNLSVDFEGQLERWGK